VDKYKQKERDMQQKLADTIEHIQSMRDENTSSMSVKLRKLEEENHLLRE
jgi:hypothetical protein